MSLFNSFKRALGFGADLGDYSEEEGVDATVYPLRTHNQHENCENIQDTQEDPNEPEQSDITATVPVDTIFSEVLAIFNQALPPFIKDSIDTEAQRKLLYDSLSESVKNYIKRLQSETEKQIACRWERERMRLNKEIETMRGKVERAEEGEQESKKSQLSAERQKRAMNERMHDLEAQVASLQAEQEQYDLENKSLVNKLRAATIHEEDNAALREQIATLSEQVRKGQSPVLSPDELAEIEKLKEKAALTDKLKEENSALLNDMEVAKAKIEMSGQLLNNQINISTSVKDKLDSKEKETEALVMQLSEARAAVDAATKEIQELKKELDDANSKVEEIHEIEKQIGRFEDIKNRKEARITELQNEKAALAEDLRVSENEVKALKKTIERNLNEQARSERELRREIEVLKSSLPAKKEPSDEDSFMVPFTVEPKKEDVQKSYPHRKKKSTVKISAIDDSLDSTDWLVSTPPENSASVVKESNDDSFGYVSPVRKTPPENDAQMLLFD